MNAEESNDVVALLVLRQIQKINLIAHDLFITERYVSVEPLAEQSVDDTEEKSPKHTA